MTAVAPDTIVRASVAELGSLSFEGDPSAVRFEYLSGADPTDELEVKSCPELVGATWELGGVKVSALIEVVSTRYCSLEDVLAYRADQYELDKLYEADSPEVWRARAQAERTIEAACHRALQPVMRSGACDRPGCRTYQMVMSDDGYDPDLQRVVRATGPDGSPASVRQLRPGSPYIDLSSVSPGSYVNVAYVSGLRAIPPEMRDAVAALSAYILSPRSAPDNAISTSTDAGVVRFVVAGLDGAATSLPEVNAVIQRYGLADPKVG